MRSIKRSPVSMFFGSRLWRKLTALQGSSRGGGQGTGGLGRSGGQGCSAGGSGHSGVHGSSGGGHGGGAGLGSSGGLGRGGRGGRTDSSARLVGAVALGNVAVIHGTHLPERICGPSFCRAFPARRDIFATWMARSSFSARSGRTKGFRAWKRANCRSSPPICLDICRKP